MQRRSTIEFKHKIKLNHQSINSFQTIFSQFSVESHEFEYIVYFLGIITKRKKKQKEDEKDDEDEEEDEMTFKIIPPSKEYFPTSSTPPPPSSHPTYLPQTSYSTPPPPSPHPTYLPQTSYSTPPPAPPRSTLEPKLLHPNTAVKTPSGNSTMNLLQFLHLQKTYLLSKQRQMRIGSRLDEEEINDLVARGFDYVIFEKLTRSSDSVKNRVDSSKIYGCLG